MKNFETLEVGKTYKNHQGGVCTIVGRREESGYFFDSCDELYTPSGKWFMDWQSLDLVEEYVDEYTNILKSNLVQALYIAINSSTKGTAFRSGLERVIADLQAGKTLIVKD